MVFPGRKRRRESAPLPSRAGTISEESAVAAPGDSTTVGQPSSKRARPVSKLNSLVNRLTKKPKMTVLGKTALDWEKYKSEHNIEGLSSDPPTLVMFH